MKLQNSYVFLKNPYWQEPKPYKDSNGMIVLTIGNNLYSYIKKCFPTISKDDGYGDFCKKKYTTAVQCGEGECQAEFIITEVVDTKYLDVVVDAKTKHQAVRCLEHIQNTILSSGVREIYIEIISFDAVSEYYCNKIYPKLNNLERNLRRLLFNSYIVNFGREYYKATVDEDLQRKIKGVVNIDSKKTDKERIKTDYHVANGKEVEEVMRLQRFFYSLEYIDIQKLLFTPNWTKADECAKAEFLVKNPELSTLSDEELRNAFAQYIPRSDWDRFFSNKIDIHNIQEMIESIREYRNSVAHFKFFYKDDYDECNVLVNRLNKAIVKAIKMTEDEDFVKKNTEILSATLTGFFEEFSAAMNSLAKKITSIFSTALTSFSHRLQESLEEKKVDEFEDTTEPTEE